MKKGLVFNVKMFYQMDVQFEVMPQQVEKFKHIINAEAY